jgi:hypothetical protein
MEWAKSLMINSCDALLVERIDEKFEDLSLYEQGGVTYIKLALDKNGYHQQRCSCNPPGFL